MHTASCSWWFLTSFPASSQHTCRRRRRATSRRSIGCKCSLMYILYLHIDRHVRLYPYLRVRLRSHASSTADCRMIETSVPQNVPQYCTAYYSRHEYAEDGTKTVRAPSVGLVIEVPHCYTTYRNASTASIRLLSTPIWLTRVNVVTASAGS